MTDEKRSRVLGMILGSVSRGQFPQREPVAFLYNGVRLPDIHSVYTPELQAKYPYAIIWYFLGACLLSVFPKDADYFYSDSQDAWYFGFDEYVDGEVGLAWRLSETENGIQWTDGTGSANIILENNMVWSNFDLYTDNTRNTLLLAKTDPVPVYE